MKKTFRLFALLTLVAVAASLSSCSKSKGKLLDYVPADASVIAYGDLNYILTEAGVSEDGKIGEPLSSALSANHADPDETIFKKIAACSNREFACFAKGNYVWVLASLSDPKALVNYLTKEEEFDLEKTDGVQVLTKSRGAIMIKDKIAFFCIDTRKDKPVEAVDRLNELCKLGDESFAESDATKELCENVIEEDKTLFIIANINKVAAMASDRDVDQMKASLSLVYNNPTYIALDATVNDEGVTSNLRVLNSDYKAAKCSLPLGQIDPAAFPYAALPDNCALGAAALPASLMSQINKTAGSFLPPEISAIFASIDGTAAATFTLNATHSDDTYAAVIPFRNSSDATDLGTMLSSQMPELKCATAGKYLRISSRTAPAAAGNVAYAEVLKGKAAGVAVDFSAAAKSLGLTGDFADLGTATLCAETTDGSLSLRAEWKCKKPVAKILNLLSNASAIENAIDNYFSSHASASSMRSSYNIYDTDFDEEVYIGI